MLLPLFCLAQQPNQMLIGANNNSAIITANIDGTNPTILDLRLNSEIDDLVDIEDAVDFPEEQKLFFTDFYGLFSMNYDGSNLTELYNPPNNFSLGAGIDIDFNTNEVYFASRREEKIYKMNMDGSGLTEVFNGFLFSDMALDVANNHIYFSVGSNINTRGLYRVNFDGTELTKLINTTVTVFTLDLIQENIYYSPTRKIFKADFNGNNVEELTPENNQIGGIFLDQANELLYFSDFELGVRTMNLDGTNPQIPVSLTDIFFIDEDDIEPIPFESPEGILLVHNESLNPNSLTLKINLQGAAINPNTAEETLMRDDLRDADLIPTISPYEDQLAINLALLETTGVNAIVDWVFIEIRQALDPTIVVSSQSALLQCDGDIVDTDGVSNIELFFIPDGNYHISIKHRNHLGVITANPMVLSTTTISLNFTNDATIVAGGENALVEVSNGIFAMIAGDFDENGQVQPSDVNDTTAAIGTSAYSNADMDMNGQIQPADVNNLVNPNVGRGVQF